MADLRTFFVAAIVAFPGLAVANDAERWSPDNILVARELAGSKNFIFKDSVREVAKGVYYIEGGTDVGGFAITGESLIDCTAMKEVGLMETPESKVRDQIAHYLKNRKGGQSDSVMIPALCKHVGFSR